MKRLSLAASFVLALGLSACNDQSGSSRAIAPIPPQTLALMAQKGMSKTDPVLMRLYKKESELEVWKKGIDGQYAKLKTFPICRWSGQLGPKTREGDRQAPEGFYTVTPAQMNPNSAYYLSFDTGYPNAFDRQHGRTGSHLMVHGNCSSRGCYALTDEGVAEVYAIARESFAGGQRGFQFQAYPFRMTAENLAKHRHDPHMPFWRNLKEGSDTFEITKREPKVAVCGGKYAFDPVAGSCTVDPTLAPVLAQKDAEDRRAVAELVAKGVPAVKVAYADGGQHESFREGSSDTNTSFAILDARPKRNLGDVSRPEALAQGPREIPIDVKGKPLPETKLAGLEVKEEARAAKAEAPSRLPDVVKQTVGAVKPQPSKVASLVSPGSPRLDGKARSTSVDAAKAIEPAKATSAPSKAPVVAAKVAPAAPADRPVVAKPAASPPAAKTSGAPQRTVDAGVLIPGALSVGPTTSGFKTN
jgi:murein L,D-transpeptidase YafK